MATGAADTQSFLAQLEALAQASRPTPTPPPPVLLPQPIIDEDLSHPRSKDLAISMEGHRSRLRARLLHAGPDAIADHELIEMVFFLAIPRRDTKQLARDLLDRFGSFAGVISASPADLCKIDGVGSSAAAALKIIQAAAHRLARTQIAERPLLNNQERVHQYLISIMAHETVEQFRVLFLDPRNRLIADEVLGRGTVNHTPVYPREVLKRALELQATALILVHNHPSGDPTPSPEDKAMTKEIHAAIKTLGLTLHDHIIVGKNRLASFRELRLL
jgi:DNA repair protein RadC